MKRLLLLIPFLALAATYGPPTSVSDISSLTNTVNPSETRPNAIVLGSFGGLFYHDAAATNAVDEVTYFPATSGGRWIRQSYNQALTNWFTFSAGTNMEVTVTGTSVSFAMTNNTFSGGSALTIDSSTATNIFGNGAIDWSETGTGNWSANLGDNTISTNKINAGFYAWVESMGGAGGGTTNGLGINGTYRTDWNLVDSAEIAYSVSGVTNAASSIVTNSIAQNKLGTAGTGTSTNFLAGDYTYKQVTTNMIPGLVDILATIGTGGSGGESNTASNLDTQSATNQGWYKSKSGVDLQFRNLQVGPNLTLTSNANNIQLDVTLSTNSGTVVSVDGATLSTANFADSSEVSFTATGTNVTAAIPTASIAQNRLNTTGTPTSTNFLAGDYAWKQVTTNMIPGLNAMLQAIASTNGTAQVKVPKWVGSVNFVITNNSTIGDFSDINYAGIITDAICVDCQNDVAIEILINFTDLGHTNYIWGYQPEGNANGFTMYEEDGGRLSDSLRVRMHELSGSIFYTGGYRQRFDLYELEDVGGPIGGGGGGGDVYASSNNVFTGSNTFQAATTNTVSVGAPVLYVGTTNVAEALAAKVSTNWTAEGYVINNQTTTSATGVNVTNMVFSIGANEVWAVEFYCGVNASGPNGVKVAIDVPTSATIGATVRGATSTTVFQITADATLTSAVMTAATGGIQIYALIQNSSNAGNVQLQFASGDGVVTATIVGGMTYYKAKRIQ